MAKILIKKALTKHFTNKYGDIYKTFLVTDLTKNKDIEIIAFNKNLILLEKQLESSKVLNININNKVLPNINNKIIYECFVS